MRSSHQFRFHPVVSQSLASLGSGTTAQVDVHTTPSLYSIAPSLKGHGHLVTLDL